WEDHLDVVGRCQPTYDIPAEVAWETPLTLTHRWIAFARERTRQRQLTLGSPPVVWPVLNDDAFTIGFARRFATYKRATLLFKDTERLKAILHRSDRPTQIIFAGKAHPADHPGKLFIQQVY